MTVTLTLGHILLAIVTLAGGGGTIGALLAAGVAQRWLVPLVKAAIITHEQSSETVEARKQAIERVIEDHVRRDDGTIHQRLRTQDDGLRQAVEALRQIVGDSAERLSRIEGLLEARYGERPTPAPGPHRASTPLAPTPPRITRPPEQR